MKKYVCDFCGCDIGRFWTHCSEFTIPMHHTNIFGLEVTDTKNINLCKECAKTMVEWVDRQKKARKS